jgi:hypothetical protein
MRIKIIIAWQLLVQTGNTQIQANWFTYISTCNTNGENGHDHPNMGSFPAKRQHSNHITYTSHTERSMARDNVLNWYNERYHLPYGVHCFPQSHASKGQRSIFNRPSSLPPKSLSILGFMLTCLTHAAETYLIILAMLPCKFARSCSRLYRPGDNVETDCSPNPVSTGDTCGSGAIIHMTGLNQTSFFKIGSCAVSEHVHVLPISTLISATSHTRLQYLVAYTMCTFYKFRVRKSVHQINQPTRCISHSDLLLVVQIPLNMFRASLCPSSGVYQLQ